MKWLKCLTQQLFSYLLFNVALHNVKSTIGQPHAIVHGHSRRSILVT